MQVEERTKPKRILTPEQAERNRVSSRAWRAANPEISRARCAKWRSENPEKFKAGILRWNAANADRCRQKKREWKKNNPDKVMADCRAQRQRLEVRIRDTLRSRIRAAVTRSGSKKADKSTSLVGCALPFLRSHLESQFTPGMTWDNYGLWHIDHRIPCAAFNLEKEDEQRRCFHYSNLQPLWATDNHFKGDRVGT